MSTKIYNAYRVKRGVKLWPVLWDIKKKATKNIQKVLIDMYNRVLSNESAKNEVRGNLKLEADCEVGPIEVSDNIKKAYRLQLGSHARNPFNFDVKVSVRELDGRFYLIAHCDWVMGEVLDFLAKDKRLEDFHYQNSSDKPDEIPQREWNLRSRTWDRMDRAGWRNFVLLTICDWDTFPYIDPAWNFGKENPWHKELKAQAERQEAKRKAASAVNAASPASPGATTASSTSAAPAPASKPTTPDAQVTTSPGPSNPSQLPPPETP